MNEEMSRYNNLSRAIGISRERIVTLRRKRTQLEEFISEIRRGQAQFQGQLENKRVVARKTQHFLRSGISRSFGVAFQTLTGGTFQEGVRSNFVKAQQDVERAIDRVNAEIAREQASIDQHERAMERLRVREEVASCR